MLWRAGTHLLDLLEDAEEVESGEALQFLNAPLAGGVQGGEQLHVLGHVLQPRGDPAQFTAGGQFLLGPPVMDQITIKTTNRKCRLY